MVFVCSDEDVNEKAVVSSWLAKNCGGSKSSQTASDLESLINDYFYPTLHLAKKCDPIVQVSLTGLIFNGLSHLFPLTEESVAGVPDDQFKCAVLHGFLGNIKDKASFLKDVCLYFEYYSI